MKQKTTTNKGCLFQIWEIIEFLIPFLVIAVIWEIVARVGLVSPTSLPAPSAIISRFWQLAFVRTVLWSNILASAYRMIVGYLLAVGIGITVGAILSLNATLRTLFEPVLSLLISVPTIAWVPVLLIIMGLGDKTVITTVFLGGFFAITYNTMRGIEMVNKNIVRAASTMGVSGVKMFFDVLLPGSLVSLVTGLRLGIGYSWRALVGGEMLAAMIEFGVGKMVFQARYWNDITTMFVGIILIGLSGYILDRLALQWLEKITVEKWGMLARR